LHLAALQNKTYNLSIMEGIPMNFQFAAQRAFFDIGARPHFSTPITVNPEKGDDLSEAQQRQKDQFRQAIILNLIFTVMGAVFAVIIAQLNPSSQLRSSIFALIIFDICRILFALSPILAIPIHLLTNAQEKLQYTYQKRLVLIMAAAATPLRFVEYTISIVPIFIFIALVSNGHGDLGALIKKSLDAMFLSIVPNNTTASFLQYIFTGILFVGSQASLAFFNSIFQKPPKVVVVQQ
jgi:hypothetical protein